MHDKQKELIYSREHIYIYITLEHILHDVAKFLYNTIITY